MNAHLRLTPGGASPARIALLGAGGYGVEVARLINKHGQYLDHPIHVNAVFDTNPERCELLVRQPGLQDVRVLKSAQQVAEDPSIDAVWLPLPHHLHAQFTEMMLLAGKAVMIEKPAAASVAEIDRMIAARDRSGRPALVGFQEIYDPSTLKLKRLLMSGEFGEVQRVTVRACWPRSATYFSRNSWAGRRLLNGRPVHDSPVNNALAHFANLGLYLAGGPEDRTARPTDVRAKAYRCAAIDNFDTVAIDATTGGGAQVLMWLTHASAGTVEPVIHIRCEKGLVTRTPTDVIFRRPGCAAKRWLLEARDRRPMLSALGAVLRGVTPADQALATLEMSRPHVELVEAVAGFPVVDVPEEDVVVTDLDGEPVRAIRGVEAWTARLEQQAIGSSLRDVTNDPGWLELPTAGRRGDQGERHGHIA